MGLNLAQNWPAYLLLGLVIWFVIYVKMNDIKQRKIEKETQNKGNSRNK